MIKTFVQLDIYILIIVQTAIFLYKGLVGINAVIPPDLPYKVQFSVYSSTTNTTGPERIMLGTLSFVNSSCKPNCTYLVNQKDSCSIQFAPIQLGLLF